MYHSPPSATNNVDRSPLPLSWLGQGLLAGMPSALAALAWLSCYETMPYQLLVTTEAIMLLGMAASAVYWLALRCGRFRWYSGWLALGVAWGAGYGTVRLVDLLFHTTPTVLHIEVNAIEGYIIDWSIVSGALAIGVILACAQAYLLRPRGLAGRAALLLTAIGHTTAWIGLFPLMLGGYIA